MEVLKSGPAPREFKMSVPELLALAMQLHRNGELEGAEKLYRGVLQAERGNANATHFLGVLMQQRGEGAQALELIRKSIDLDPNVAPWYNNLGNVLVGQQRFDEAAAAYAQCSELDPSNREVLNNLGVLLRRLERLPESEEVLKRAVALYPDFTDAHSNLAVLYSMLDREDEAFAHFAKAVALTPGDQFARRLLARAYGKAGRFDDGRKFLREWLEIEPDHPQALHLLAAYGGTEVPDRASDQYVEDEFDGFATSFDAKLASLGYRAPQQVGDAVARLFGAPQPRRNILDVGCGTGLCGPHLRPYAKTLLGVDLSTNMLGLARARGLYDRLIKAELVAFMQSYKKPQDLVVSADTLIYFGRLDAAFAAARQVLVPGGHLVFTAEAHTGAADFTLQAHGRYSHGRGYLESQLARAGFDGIDIGAVVLRSESDQPVTGWLVCAQAGQQAGEILQDRVKEPQHGR